MVPGEMQQVSSPSPANRNMWQPDPLLRNIHGGEVDQEKEPLLKKNDGLKADVQKRAIGVRPDLNKKNGWTMFFLFLKLTLAPMYVFMSASLVFMLGYYFAPVALMAVCGVLCLFLMFMSWRMYLSYFAVEAFAYAVLAFALVMGSASGTSIYLVKLIDYWPYHLKRHYTNVAPDEPAGSHADASVLVFMQGAKPDGSRSMAYRRYGTDWCVAPIAMEPSYSDDLSVSTDIQYWAIGQDCCMGHDGFNCDAAQDPKAHSGIVKTRMSTRDKMLTGVMNPTELSYYTEAVKMSTAKYDITTPKENLFVRFVADVEQAYSSLYYSAWWDWWAQQLSWGWVWVVSGLFALVIGKDTWMLHISDAKTNTLLNFNQII